MEKCRLIVTLLLLLVLTAYNSTSVEAQRKHYEYSHLPTRTPERSKSEQTVAEAVGFIIAENPDVPIKKAKKIVKAVKKASKKYNVKPEVLVGLMHVESTFDTTSVSKKGSIGVMQIHAKTWMKKSSDSTDLPSVGICARVSDLYNEDTNILAGAYILRHYLDQAEKLQVKNTYRYALTRYRGGTSNSHYVRTMKSVSKLKKFTNGGKNA